MYVLNKRLGRKWAAGDRDAVWLESAGELWVDVRESRGRMENCRGHGHAVSDVCPQCLERLSAAADLYRGEFMQGFTLRDAVSFEDWQFQEARNLEVPLGGVLEPLRPPECALRRVPRRCHDPIRAAHPHRAVTFDDSMTAL